MLTSNTVTNHVTYLPLWVGGGARKGRSQRGNSVEGEVFARDEICFVTFECFETSTIGNHRYGGKTVVGGDSSFPALYCSPPLHPSIHDIKPSL